MHGSVFLAHKKFLQFRNLVTNLILEKERVTASLFSIMVTILLAYLDCVVLECLTLKWLSSDLIFIINNNKIIQGILARD